jgi:hypothetical protein
MFRFFGRLHARILLHNQDQLIELEQKLDQLDRDETTPYFLASRRDDMNIKRQKILAEIEQKLKEYSKSGTSY